MTVIAFSGAIGPIKIDCVVREDHVSELTITKNPIEFGADVADHAYIEPKKIRLDIADCGAAATYQALVRFQESRVPFTLVTGLAVYANMLIARIRPERYEDNAFILRADVEIEEVIVVSTSAGPGSEGAGQPGGTNSRRAASPEPGRVSGADTANRAGGVQQRGSTVTQTAPTTGSSPAAAQNRSILSQMFG